MTRPLTNQERYVLYCLHNELSNPIIASAMGLSKNTVKVHKSNLYKKLGLIGLGKAAALKELQKFVKDNGDLFDGLLEPDTDAYLAHELMPKPVLVPISAVDHTDYFYGSVVRDALSAG